jgi:flavin reductase (DIM6/NTAB) family NADH-FMN oxidoreductase RutF
VATTPDELRRVMGRFATGVTVVTTLDGDQPHGMTANAVASVSLRPPLVLVCVDRAADSHDIIDRAGLFALNVLSRDQQPLSDRFAVKEGESAHGLEGVPHHAGATGAPILDGAIAFLECRVAERYPGGDHTIFLGEVVAADPLSDDGPLIFYQGRYLALE